MEYTTATVPATSNEHVIVNLEPGARYNVTVSAQNAADVGPTSKQRTQKILETNPGNTIIKILFRFDLTFIKGLVDELTIVPLSSSSMKISWLPPKEPNGDISKYHLSLSTENEVEILSITYEVDEVNFLSIIFLGFDL